MSADNSSMFETVLYGHPPCEGWTNNTEGAFYHLANSIMFLGYMGGSGPYGALFIFSFFAPSHLCLALWGWLTLCALDVFTWNLLLLLACLAQLAHLFYRLHHDGLPGPELSALYSAVYLPLGVPVQVFKEMAGACENQVLALGAEETYAVEGKTPIDRLSFLLSGRIRVSLEGQFLHYIFPHQFLDSPEWESLRPSEEGNFQVTLTAETECRYISWRRRRLYQLLSRERGVARLFSVMLGSDIADKLYSLNDKLFAKSGVRLDIRLPSLYHVLAPSPPASERGSGSGGASVKDQGAPGGPVEHQALTVEEDPAPAYQRSAPPQPPQPRAGHPPAGQSPQGQSPPGPCRPPQHSQPWPSDVDMLSGEDSTSLVLEDFADMTGSLMDYGSERDYLR